jgi:hypothetical protein
VTFNAKRKTAFLVPSGPRDLLHLHIILTDECPDGLHLVATVSSIKPGMKHDPTCKIAAREHEFITLDSFVMYGLLGQMPKANIERLVAKGYYVQKADVSDDLCDRICDGVEKSDFTKRGMIKYYRENC